MIIPIDVANRIVRKWRSWNVWSRVIPQWMFRNLVYDIAVELAKQNSELSLWQGDPMTHRCGCAGESMNLDDKYKVLQYWEECGLFPQLYAQWGPPDWYVQMKQRDGDNANLIR